MADADAERGDWVCKQCCLSNKTKYYLDDITRVTESFHSWGFGQENVGGQQIVYYYLIFIIWHPCQWA